MIRSADALTPNNDRFRRLALYNIPALTYWRDIKDADSMPMQDPYPVEVRRMDVSLCRFDVNVNHKPVTSGREQKWIAPIVPD
jgi:hypothetical protein